MTSNNKKSFYTNIKKYQNDILYSGYDKEGKKIFKKIKYKPTLYVQQKDNNIVSKYKSFGLNPIDLAPMKFESMKEAQNFIKSYSNIENFGIYGTKNFQDSFISELFGSAGEIEYNPEQIKVYILDIEVFSGNGFPEPTIAQEEITSISIKDKNANHFYFWSVKEYIPHIENVTVFRLDSEQEMLNHFVSWWSTNYPDVVTGWYSRDFDIPYIINRIKNILGEKCVDKLSPWGIVTSKESSVKRFGHTSEKLVYELWGISELDYLDLYKKYTSSNKENYKLGFIGKLEVNQDKVEFEGSLNDLYERDFQTYAEYNIMDVELIDKIDKKLGYLGLFFEVAYSGRVSVYNDALGTIKFWETSVYHYLASDNIYPTIDDSKSKTKEETFVGAYVMEPKAGKHLWTVTLDAASLYPSLIRQVNIGPETHIPYHMLSKEIQNIADACNVEDLLSMSIDTSALKKHDLSLSANGQLYRRDIKSFGHMLMEDLFNKRRQFQKAKKEATDSDLVKFYDTKQMAAKIRLNAFYGAQGNKHFKYYSLENATAVTLTGQLVIRYAAKAINEYLNRILKCQEDKQFIVYSDTDSVFVDMKELVHKLFTEDQIKNDKYKIAEFIAKFFETKLEPEVNKAFDKLSDYLNSHHNQINFKREIIADVTVFCAKKKYCMNVLDNEGKIYNPPSEKIMGIEVVRSSTPAFCRKLLKQAISIILREDNESLLKHIKNVRDEFFKLNPEDIAFPRGVSDVSKYQLGISKQIPIHVRGSLIHNYLLKKNHLTKKYDDIKNGDKIKFVYLKLPNPLHQDVIAFNEKIPKEFDIEKYVDYKLQFQKTFIDPLTAITDLIEWKTEESYDLSDAFN